jgi:hypothetical protein
VAVIPAEAAIQMVIPANHHDYLVTTEDENTLQKKPWHPQ